MSFRNFSSSLRQTKPTAEAERPDNRSAMDSSTTAIDASIDPFLLDFGTSVNVNEDLRRVIRGEIQEIETSIVSISEENRKEESVARQLQKDLSFSHQEMSLLRQRTMDQLEKTQIHKTLIGGLGRDLNRELLPSKGAPASSSTENIAGPTTGQGHGIQDRMEHGDERGLSSNKEAVAQHYIGMFTALNAQLKGNASAVDGLVSTYQSTIENLESIELRMANENLSAQVEQKEKEYNSHMAELESEKEQLETLKAAVRQKRKESGANAQQVADLSKQLQSDHRRHVVEKQKVLEDLAMTKENSSHLEKQLVEHQAEVAGLGSKLEELEKTEKLFEELLDLDKKIASQRDANESLSKERDELQDALNQQEKKLEQAEEDLCKAEQKKAEALKLRSENDDKFKTIVEPAKLELAKIAERKEASAKEIEQTQKTSTQLRESEKEALEAKVKEHKAAEGELASLENEASDLQEKIDALVAEKEDFERKVNAEIEENCVLDEQLQAAIQAEKNQIQDNILEEKKRVKQEEEEATAKSEELTAANERLQYVLNTGINLIEKAKGKIEGLGEPFQLDEINIEEDEEFVM